MSDISQFYRQLQASCLFLIMNLSYLKGIYQIYIVHQITLFRNTHHQTHKQKHNW